MRKLREYRYAGFCRLLQLAVMIIKGCNLVVSMVLASLRSPNRGASRFRAVEVIHDSPALIVTDTLMGLC